MIIKSNPQLGGGAGECFVTAALSQRDLIASITMRNSTGIDIPAKKRKTKT